ncbi:hypothetical protein [Algoriphagus vanfongensis]|uniref:hypothetical protein n=1 Tax=Algoriphagus vanfongensis TaxID=426371 RepID=UPI0003F6C5F5|nr:hypothetical protein [Algoriphagus vanfongensis]
MLEALTWNHYFSALAFGLTAYYLGIAILYYPQEIRSLISGKTMRFNLISQSEKVQPPHQTESDELDPFEELEITVAELQGILGKAGNMTGKQDLHQQLSHILSNHPGLREPAYRVAILNFLTENIPKNTHFDFNESELQSLWGQE